MLTSPKAFFGFVPGSDRELAHWDKIVKYYEILGRESDRVLCETLGPTTEGRPFLRITVSAPDNLRQLEKYRHMSLLLSDPRNVPQPDVDSACKEGKAVCVQMASMHATELAATQTMINIVWALVSGCDAETSEILENVIFVLIPCANPDGQVQVIERYLKYRGTEYDAVDEPRLWSPAGYSNNCDIYSSNLIESRYINTTVLFDWMPQVFVDHHQMPRTWARMFVPPYADEIQPYTNPLVWREVTRYGADMAYALEQAGVSGVISHAYFPTHADAAYRTVINMHNIAGILTESASARFASPTYVHPENLETGPRGIFYPNPWRGGWWRFSDIARQQTIATRALLVFMARDRERILRCMAQKALGQTRAGADDPRGAFLIPTKQHDTSSAARLCALLRGQEIEMLTAEGYVDTSQGTFPAGTVVVPLAQPKYAVIMALLDDMEYPKNKNTLLPDSSIEIYGDASSNYADYLGVHVLAVGQPVACRLAPFKAFPRREPLQGVLPCCENDSFRQANSLLREGANVWRSQNGDFYTANPPEDAASLRLARVGVYRTTWGCGRLGGGNDNEAHTRLVLDRFGFPFVTVGPADITADVLDHLDVLILPNNMPGDIDGTNASIKELLPEDRVWLGPAEEERLRIFVQRGGKLLAIASSFNYVVRVFNLKVENCAEGIPASRYNTHGSMLRVRVADSPLTRGMPKDALVYHFNAPVLKLAEYFKPFLYRTDMRFQEDRLLKTGICVGGELLAGRPCMVTAFYGCGEVVLYAFTPQHRAETDGTFKTIFNALYIES